MINGPQFIANLVVRRPWWVIACMLALVALAVPGVARLYVTSSYRIYFEADHPLLRALESMEAEFSKRETVLFVLAPADGDVFTRGNLAAIAYLTDRAGQMPLSRRVDSISNFQYTRAEGDDLLVEDLYGDLEQLSEQELLERKHYALGEQALLNRLLNPDGSVTGVLVSIDRPGTDDFGEVSSIKRFADELQRDMQARFPDLEVRLTGTVMSDAAFAEASIRDGLTLIPLAFLFIVVSIGLLLRSAQGTALTLAVISLSVAFAAGAVGYLGFSLNPATIAAPVVIMMTVIADCMHVLVSFFNHRRDGLDKTAAVRQTLERGIGAMALTNVNNCIGFFSMNFSDVPPFRALGNFVGIGVIASFLLAVLLLPALLMVLRVKPPYQRDRDSTVYARLCDWVIRRRNWVLWGCVIGVLVTVAGIPRNQLNDVFVHYFDDSFAFRRDLDFTDRHLTGAMPIDYALDSGAPEGIYRPRFLFEVEKFADWARQQPEVIHVDAITSVFKRVNRAAHEDQYRYYAIPADAETAAQELLMYELSLPFGFDLSDLVNVDRSAVRVTLLMRTMSSREALAFEARADKWLAQNMSYAHPSQATGPVLMFAHIGQDNIRSMLFGTLVSFVLIADMLILALGSVPFGIISLIPNLLPAMIGFGLWGYLYGEIGLSLSVVTTMTLGIVVDDTIHFLHKYLHGRRQLGLSAADSIRHVYREVGESTTITSVVLVLGFSVLAFSPFLLNATMGMLTALVLAVALVLELLLMPALLLFFEPKARG